jgi:cell division protein ZapA (FtsZ GTPase activity inhibitor)
VPVSDLRLDLLGTSFSITADEDPGYLRDILDQYRAALTNTQKNMGMKDPLKTAILTGFLLCDEVHKLRNRGASPEDEEAEQRALNLIARLEEAEEAMKPKPPAHE